jgi:hypothetical protein
MKKILLLIILFTGVYMHAQKNVTLFFRNGDSLKVISYVSSGMTTIKYRISEDSKKIKVDYKKVKKVVRYFKSDSTTYTYKIKKGYTTPILLEQVASGKMYLYRFNFTRNSNFGNGMSMSSNHSEYYICKEDKDVVITFNASGIFIENSFRKKSKIIFKDCPALLKKILDKTWKMKNIPEIVEYYNNQCTSIEE